VKMFDAGKTRMIGLPYGDKTDNMLSRFHLITERYGQTDRQTDGRTDRRTYRRTELLFQYRLTRDKNRSSVHPSVRCQLDISPWDISPRTILPPGQFPLPLYMLYNISRLPGYHHHYAPIYIKRSTATES